MRIIVIQEVQEIIGEIFIAMRQEAPGRWENLQLIATSVGAGTDFTTKVTSADGGSTSFRLEHTTASACSKLRRTMFQPGKGTWYSAHFTINSAGECDVRYDYDSIPLDPDFDETLEDIRDSLIEDQELFPRDQEFLPEWHPCRAKP
jgi:hypothetical protein